MKRRRFLQLVAGALALGWIEPPAAGLRTAADRTRRAPADLMARLRRRTRPLTSAEIDRPHDLAG